MKLAAEHDNVSCEVLERAQMETLGMGSLLAVARGSANPPHLIVLRYTGAGDAKPYALVGKGITFDTGGINLKVQGGIEEMKFDMCGAATVHRHLPGLRVGMQLPLNLVVVVPAVENMPDADAYRPSDVLTAMTGKTIEVGNTDAEGRLILCDALTYAQRFEPQATVDVATLTGACVIALGKYAAGLMSKHDDLADELLAAGETRVRPRLAPAAVGRVPDACSIRPSPTSTTSAARAPARSPPAASCRASPKASAGRIWTSPASSMGRGRKGLATGRPVGPAQPVVDGPLRLSLISMASRRLLPDRQAALPATSRCCWSASWRARPMTAASRC